jgi:hypothetical protein
MWKQLFSLLVQHWTSLWSRFKLVRRDERIMEYDSWLFPSADTVIPV